MGERIKEGSNDLTDIFPPLHLLDKAGSYSYMRLLFNKRSFSCWHVNWKFKTSWQLQFIYNLILFLWYTSMYVYEILCQTSL